MEERCNHSQSWCGRGLGPAAQVAIQLFAPGPSEDEKESGENSMVRRERSKEELRRIRSSKVQ